jgi:hypothetical protein
VCEEFAAGAPGNADTEHGPLASAAKQDFSGQGLRQARGAGNVSTGYGDGPRNSIDCGGLNRLRIVTVPVELYQQPAQRSKRQQPQAQSHTCKQQNRINQQRPIRGRQTSKFAQITHR